MNEHYIYVAYLDDVPRYIGFGKNKRFEHVNSGASHVRRLNEVVLRDGQTFDVYIVASNLSRDRAAKLEREYISIFKRESEGGPLYNLTDGGIGFYSSHTEESKERIREHSKKVWDSLTEEERAKRKSRFAECGANTRFSEGKQSTNSELYKYGGSTFVLTNIVTNEEHRFINKRVFVRENPAFKFVINLRVGDQYTTGARANWRLAVQ